MLSITQISTVNSGNLISVGPVDGCHGLLHQE